MKSLVIAALVMIFAVSGCSGKRCCHKSGSESGSHMEKFPRGNFAEGGAQWGGEKATEDATVQFASAATFNADTKRYYAIPTFTFIIERTDSAYDAARAMASAFNDRRDRERCPPASPSNRDSRIACHEEHVNFIRFINHDTQSDGVWEEFRADLTRPHLPGGLWVNKVPYKP